MPGLVGWTLGAWQFMKKMEEKENEKVQQKDAVLENTRAELEEQIKEYRKQLVFRAAPIPNFYQKAKQEATNGGSNGGNPGTPENGTSRPKPSNQSPSRPRTASSTVSSSSISSPRAPSPLPRQLERRKSMGDAGSSAKVVARVGKEGEKVSGKVPGKESVTSGKLPGGATEGGKQAQAGGGLEKSPSLKSARSDKGKAGGKVVKPTSRTKGLGFLAKIGVRRASGQAKVESLTQGEKAAKVGVPKENGTSNGEAISGVLSQTVVQ